MKKINKETVMSSMKDASAYSKVMTKTYLWTISALLGIAVIMIGSFAGFASLFGEIAWNWTSVPAYIFGTGIVATAGLVILGFNPVSLVMLKLAKSKVNKKAIRKADNALRVRRTSARSFAKTATK